MKSYNIDHYRTLYVIPFEFKSMEDDFSQAVKRIGDALGGEWELSEPYFNEKASGERDVYHQVTHEFDCTEGVDKKMGCFWKKKGPITDTTTIDVRNVEGTVHADIPSVGLYAFRTGIGFLCYEAVFRIEKKADPDGDPDGVPARKSKKAKSEEKKLTSEQLYQIQFYFKELAHERKPVYINGDGEPQGFGRHIAKFLKRLDVRYPASRKNACLKTHPEEPELVPDKALLFTYVVFEHDPDWVADNDALSTVYYLTHGYKESYHMSQDAEKAIMRPFSNCFWGASKEGCGHISWPTGSGLANNSPFFCQNSHALKTINDYFTLYIRALYLSYSLFHLAKELDDLSCDYRDYFDYEKVSSAVEEQLIKIRNLRAKINVFLAKSVMTSVSHIQHQNEFYAHVINQLRVNQDIASVQAGLDALGALSESAVDANKTEALRLEREREKMSDERFQAGLACITLLALFSALADAYQVVDGIRNGNLEKWEWAIVVFLFLICIVAFSIALYFSWDVLKRTILSERDRKKKEKEARKRTKTRKDGD